MFGRHINIRKSFLDSFKFANNIYNIKAIQIFLKGPKRYSLCKIKDFESIKDFVVKNGIYVVSHSTYLFNLAKETKYIDMIIDDINCIVKLGGNGTVVHVGKSCKRDIDLCNKIMIKNIKHILDLTEKGCFILETAAGQGSEMLVTIEKMSEFYNMFEEKYKERIRFCIDTCHIFAAGYDLTNNEKIDDYFNRFDRLIGIDKVEVVHFNDSKMGCGSRKDRHESLGCGKIGLDNLKYIYKKLLRYKIPVILETSGTIPVEDEFEILRNISLDS